MTYPLATLAPTVSDAGISAPTYNDVLQSLIAQFQAIYGADIYVAPDSQDGQWIAVLARAIHDSNQAAIAVFHAFSPAYAQGAGLSTLVQLNGISRRSATRGTATGKVVGVVGTAIINGIVQDAQGNQWTLPGSVVIPMQGELLVTITAVDIGFVLAPVGSINQIHNPQLGWQSFVNTTAATTGAPIETDTELRNRQADSAAVPALSTREALYAAVANVSGVNAAAVYDNDTYLPDTNGVPAHSVCVIVSGGDISAVAAAIALKKPPGVPTFGDTSVTVYDSMGLPSRINFFQLDLVETYYSVVILPLAGYNAATGVSVQKALKDFTNALRIGAPVYLAQAAAVASLLSTGLGFTFNVSALYVGSDPGALAATDLTLVFNQKAQCTSADNVRLVVVQ